MARPRKELGRATRFCIRGSNLSLVPTIESKERPALKIISWNLLHRSGATIDEIVRLIHHENPDLLLMQETTDRIDALPNRIGGHYLRDPLPGRNHGLASWSRKPFLESPALLKLQAGIIFNRVCQIVQVGNFVVANVHLSHGQVLNRRQLARICQVLPPRAAVIGDCNLIGPPLLANFHDVGPRQGTLGIGGVASLRLDRCFVRGLNCEGSQALVKGSSDHQPIVVWLSVPVEDIVDPRPK
jgi:endonuclease/exonuclease/phosphatase (EEP) superfamily protein YafD